MTHKIANDHATWIFEAAGTDVYVTKVQNIYTTPGGRTIKNQVMFQGMKHTIKEAREFWSLLLSVGAVAV